MAASEAGEISRGEHPGVVVGDLHELVGFLHPVDETHGGGLLGQDHPAREQEVGGPGEPDQPGEQPGEAVLGRQPQPAVGRGELGPGGGEAEVAVAGQGEADAGGGAVDGGDDGLGDAEVVGEVGVELGPDPEAGPGQVGRGAGVVAAPFDVALRARVSAPAQKPRPAPVTTMTLTPGSAAARASRARYSVCILPVQAFSRSGRTRVMVATARPTARSG